MVQRIVNLHGQKYLKWPGNFLRIDQGLRDHDVIVKTYILR